MINSQKENSYLKKDSIVIPLNKNDINKKIIECLLFCKTHTNDSVNSLDIFDNLVAFGTLMGNLYLCRIKNNKYFSFQMLHENQIENIENKKIEKLNNTNHTNSEIEINNNYKEKKIELIEENENEDSNRSEKSLKKKINNQNMKTNDKKNSNIRLNVEQNKNSIITDKSLNNKNSDNNLNIQNKYEYPEISHLIKMATENIQCVSFENYNCLNISIGDCEVIKLENIYNFNSNDPESSFDFTKIKNYPNENTHILYCENATCFLKKHNFIILRTQFYENNEPIILKKIFYENKDLNEYKVQMGEIEMSNYCIPHDYDGKNIIYVDYYSKSERKIIIFNFDSKEYLKFDFELKFGDINFLKFIRNNKIFLVRHYNICEIRDLKTFEILESFNHIGEEIISVFVYIDETKITGNLNLKKFLNINDIENISKVYNKDDNSINSKNSFLENKNKQVVQIYNENKIGLDNKNENVNKTISIDKQLNIATLDINGNFNIYNNKIEKNIFNIYNINNIDKIYKEKQFFATGFPYYITMNDFFYVISTDHGIFVFNRQ